MGYSEQEERRLKKYTTKLTHSLPKWMKKRFQPENGEEPPCVVGVTKEGQLELLCHEEMPDKDKFEIGRKFYAFIDANPHAPFMKLEVIN